MLTIVVLAAWQHPFVSVLKVCDVDTWKNLSKEGNVVAVLDKSIGKRVFNITGAVSAANHVLLPKRSQSLGLTGRFLYIQVCAAARPAQTLKSCCDVPTWHLDSTIWRS